MMRAYGRSKLCNILFTRELASRLDPGEVVATCLHPGMVATAIGQRGGLVGLGWRLMKPFMISPEKGAETPVFLATVPDPSPFHGGYVIRKAVAEPDPAALDSGLGSRLWDESARLGGTTMSWVYLFTAGLFEIGWPVGLKWAQEPGKPLVGIVVAVVSMAASGALLFLGAEGDRARHRLCGVDRHRRRRDLCGRRVAVWRPEQPRPLSRRRADHHRSDYTKAGPLNKTGISNGTFQARILLGSLSGGAARHVAPRGCSLPHRRRPR